MIRTLMIPLQKRTLGMKMCHVILTSCHMDVIINLVLMVVVLDKNVISFICQKSDGGCWICDDCYKEGAHHGHNKWIKEKDNI